MTDSEQPASERVTVNLNANAAHALNGVAELSGDTKTDVINKALRVYGELVQADTDGRGVYIRTAGTLTRDGELERVRFL